MNMQIKYVHRLIALLCPWVSLACNCYHTVSLDPWFNLLLLKKFQVVNLETYFNVSSDVSVGKTSHRLFAPSSPMPFSLRASRLDEDRKERISFPFNIHFFGLFTLETILHVLRTCISAVASISNNHHTASLISCFLLFKYTAQLKA